MAKRPISLYDCSHSRYPVPPDEFIVCAKGHKLGSGNVHKRQADREDRLIFRVCSLCKDVDEYETRWEK